MKQQRLGQQEQQGCSKGAAPACNGASLQRHCCTHCRMCAALLLTHPIALRCPAVAQSECSHHPPAHHISLVNRMSGGLCG